MKKVKNYIAPELAKKKLARYKYWSLKDENGITVCSSEENNPDNKGFAEVLDQIIEDNVDAEVQVKFGTSEQSSRQNIPFFIKINDEIEWVEPEEPDQIKINGVPHRTDKNGNVNIQLSAMQEQEQRPRVEQAEQITWRDEMEIQLNGIKQESQIKEERLLMEMQNKLQEQHLKFQEMLLFDREARISEREQALAEAEALIEERKKEIREDVSAYVKEIPNALGGLVKSFIKSGGNKESLGSSTAKPESVKRDVQYDFDDDEDDEEEDFDNQTRMAFSEEEIDNEQNDKENENIQSEAGDNSEERGATARETPSV